MVKQKHPHPTRQELSRFPPARSRPCWQPQWQLGKRPATGRIGGRPGCFQPGNPRHRNMASTRHFVAKELPAPFRTEFFATPPLQNAPKQQIVRYKGVGRRAHVESSLSPRLPMPGEYAEYAQWLIIADHHGFVYREQYPSIDWPSHRYREPRNSYFFGRAEPCS